MLLMAAPVAATEKYWIAHQAELIVIGTFHRGILYPWYDGWHQTGTISVNEVLYGHRTADRVNFHFVYTHRASWWPPPRFFDQYVEKGLWFLKPVDKQTWEPASEWESGFRPLSGRSDLKNYIRRVKH
jgi:hypothetical protein